MSEGGGRGGGKSKYANHRLLLHYLRRALRLTIMDLLNHAQSHDYPDTSITFLTDTVSQLYPEEGGFGAGRAHIFDHPPANGRGRNGMAYANRPAIAILLSILYQVSERGKGGWGGWGGGGSLQETSYDPILFPLPPSGPASTALATHGALKWPTFSPSLPTILCSPPFFKRGSKEQILATTRGTRPSSRNSR